MINENKMIVFLVIKSLKKDFEEWFIFNDDIIINSKTGLVIKLSRMESCYGINISINEKKIFKKYGSEKPLSSIDELNIDNTERLDKCIQFGDMALSTLKMNKFEKFLLKIYVKKFRKKIKKRISRNEKISEEKNRNVIYLAAKRMNIL